MGEGSPQGTGFWVCGGWSRAALCDLEWPVLLEVGCWSACFTLHTDHGELKPGSLPAVAGPCLHMLLKKPFRPSHTGPHCLLQGHSLLLAFGFELGGKVLEVLPLSGRPVFVYVQWTLSPAQGHPCQVSSANVHGLSFGCSFDDFSWHQSETPTWTPPESCQFLLFFTLAFALQSQWFCPPTPNSISPVYQILSWHNKHYHLLSGCLHLFLLSRLVNLCLSFRAELKHLFLSVWVPSVSVPTG